MRCLAVAAMGTLLLGGPIWATNLIVPANQTVELSAGAHEYSKADIQGQLVLRGDTSLTFTYCRDNPGKCETPVTVFSLTGPLAAIAWKSDHLCLWRLRTDHPDGSSQKDQDPLEPTGSRANLSTRPPAEPTINSYQFTRNAAGEVVEISRTEPVKANLAASRTVYTYSEADRLVNSVSGGKTTNYAFDLNGNLISRKLGLDEKIYTYDALNRLTGVRDSSQTTTYAYDGLGNRVAKTYKGEKTRYLRDGSALYAALAATGDVQTYYIHGAGAILYAIDSTAGLLVYHTDDRGSVTAVTDSSQTVVSAS